MLKSNIFVKEAGVAELVDVLDLGSSAARRGGSSPFTRTLKPHELTMRFFCFIQANYLDKYMYFRPPKNKKNENYS